MDITHRITNVFGMLYSVWEFEMWSVFTVHKKKTQQNNNDFWNFVVWNLFICNFELLYMLPKQFKNFQKLFFVLINRAINGRQYKWCLYNFFCAKCKMQWHGMRDVCGNNRITEFTRENSKWHCHRIKRSVQYFE